MFNENVLIVFLIFMVLTFMVVSFSPAHSHEQAVRRMIEYYRGNMNHGTLEKLSSVISNYAHRYDIESHLVVAIMWRESQLQNRQSYICEDDSTYKCEKPSNREKSCGFGQMQPETFELVMGYPPVGDTRLEQCMSLVQDWPTAVHAMIKHLRGLRNRYGYLEGIGTYNCLKCRDENKWYVRSVLNIMHPISDYH